MASTLVRHSAALTFLFTITVSESVRAGGTWAQLAHAPPAGLNNALLLTDGTVICGDGGSGWYRLTPDNKGSYHDGTWTAIAATHYTRLFYSSDVLTNGNVYVAGGEYGTGKAHAEWYDSLNNVWTEVPPPSSTPGYSDAVSKILPGGRVLQGTTGGGVWIYNPNLNTITATGSARNQNEACWVKLTNDCVLTIDAFGMQSEHYNPATSTWVNDNNVPVTLYGYGGEMGAGFVLPNGNVFYIGGSPSTAIYTPGSTAGTAGTWVAGPEMVFGGTGYGAVDAPAAMMVNGKILCALGTTNGFGSTTWFYEYDYVSNAFTQVNGPTGATYGSAPFATSMLELPDGTILFIGGQGSTSVYIYTPDGTPLPMGQPAINSITLNTDGSYHLTGTGLTGISGGAAYGDDWQMDTDYPMVRLTNTVGGNVYYARTFKWNATSIMTGSRVLTTEFTLPPTLPAGTYSLVVSANGNSSLATNFTYAPLAVPTGLKAVVGSSQLTLSWNAVSNAVTYTLKRATSVNGYLATIATTGGTSFLNTGLTNGATYYYSVCSVGSGGPSPNSTNLIVTPFGPPPVPTGLVAGPDSYVGVNLDWNASIGATNYNVKRSTVNGGPYTSIAARANTDYDDTNVVAGTKYYYVVTAVSPGGESSNSAQGSATPTGSVDVTNGLVAYWSFDDNGGSTAADSSSNVNTGTLVNGPTWIAPGRIGTSSLYFDTNLTQSVTANNAASLNMTAGITISAWVLPVDWNGNRRILQKGNSDNQYRILCENSLFKFHLNGVGTLTCALPPTNVWTHFAGTWDGATMSIYSNGLAVASLAASGSIATTADLLAIGKKNTGTAAGDFWYGQLDEVRLYNRALAPSEITTIMHAGDSPLNTPTGVAIYPGNTRASLVWTSSGAASSYNVKRSTVNGGPYATIANSLTAAYTDNGLTNGTTYYYVVTAINGTNETANSSQVSTIPALGVSFFADINYGGKGSSVFGPGSYTLSQMISGGVANDTISSCRIPNNWGVTIYKDDNFMGTAWPLYADTLDFSILNGLNDNLSSCKITNNAGPAIPASVTAAGGNGQITVFWRASTGASSYNIRRSTTNGGPYIPILGTIATNVTDTGLLNGTNYYYVVSAVSTNGESALSSVVTAAPLAPPATPSGLVAIASNTLVSLSWNAAAGAAKYNLKRSLTNGGPYTIISTPTATNYTDLAVANGTTYYYVVSATNNAAESGNSSQVSATPLAPPPIPTGLSAIAGDSQVALSWNSALGADAYKLKRSTTNGGPYVIISGRTGTNYTDIGLTNGVTYFYVVSSTNSIFESGDSAQASATPVATPITLAIGPSSPGQYTLQFSGVNGQTYIVQTSTNLVDWSDIYTNQQSGGLYIYTNSDATDLVRFYRVRQ